MLQSACSGLVNKPSPTSPTRRNKLVTSHKHRLNVRLKVPSTSLLRLVTFCYMQPHISTGRIFAFWCPLELRPLSSMHRLRCFMHDNDEIAHR